MVALACHPSRPIVAACLSDGTICLWNYHGADGRGSGRFSGGSGGGDMAGSGGGYMGGVPGAGMGSPTLSPPKGVRGASKAGKDEKCVGGLWRETGGVVFGWEGAGEGGGSVWEGRGRMR